MSDRSRELAACLCGATEATTRQVRSKDELSLESFTYVTCSQCGTERIQRRPSAREIGSFYPDSYASHIIRPKSLGQRVRQLVYKSFYAPVNVLGALRPLLRIVLRPLRGYSVMPFMPSGDLRRVFEFGAATGNDLALYRSEGWEIDGCEPSARACAMAAVRGIEIRNCDAETVRLEPEAYSAMLLNNVLEHTHAPQRVLEHCAQALIQGGHIVIIVPNHDSWSARYFGASWPGYDAPRHLWGFTPRSLTEALARAGLRVERIHHLFQGRWAWQAAIDGRHQAEPVPAWRVRIARPLSLLLLPVGWLAATCGRGDFMTVVARR